MTMAIDRVLFWMPRVLGISLAAFVSIFALDAFEGDAPLWQKLIALLIHLIPTFALAAALIVAWRWELTGGFVFVVLGVVALLLLNTQQWTTHLFITLPVFIIGVLFMLDWVHRENVPPIKVSRA